MKKRVRTDVSSRRIRLLSTMCLALSGLFAVLVVANLVAILILADRTFSIVQVPILVVASLLFLGGWRALERLVRTRSVSAPDQTSPPP